MRPDKKQNNFANPAGRKNMYKIILATTAFLAVASPAFAQAKATTFTKAQIDAVLKAGPNAVDHTIQVFDMGDYAMSVAIIKRDAPKPRPPGAPAPTPRADAVKCGLTAAPAGAKDGPGGMISHDFTVETYIVTSGSGTLVTGGQIVGGNRSAPDSDVTEILNGTSCSGKVVGDFKTQVLSAGDVAVIPAGIPHGWTNVTDQVTYLSVRPDPKKVLKHGYVNPAIQ
jgi:mannose-6-phosphate isomerase-like protein (cupin superfamily)